MKPEIETSGLRKFRYIRVLRAVIGVSILVIISRVFVIKGSLYDKNLASFLLDTVGEIVARIQIITVLMSAISGIMIAVLLVSVIIVITVIFGRLYCASICPLGILQDMAFRTGSFFRKRKLRFIRGGRIFWFSMLIVSVFAGLAGLSVVIGWMDPYSLFGKMMTFAVRPMYAFIHNNMVIHILMGDNFSAQQIPDNTFIPLLFIVTMVLLSGIFAIALFKGRIWCNFICPAGAGLGLLSRAAPFKMRIGNKCTSCGHCESVCRGRCIHVGDRTIDDDRCVRCFDCAAECPAGAVNFGLKGTSDSPGDNNRSESRKNFIRKGLMSGAVIGAGLVFPKSVIGGLRKSMKDYPIPPGGISGKRFTELCTACGLCAARCPSGVIRPAVFEKGAIGLMQPLLDFTKGYCVYECAECSGVCPTGALKKMTHDEKRKLSIGTAVFEEKNCIVYINETSCGACAEVCPTHAVTMIKYKKGLMIPVVDESICIGCGACVFQCPARPKALQVNGRDEQKFISIKMKKSVNDRPERNDEGKEDFPF